MATDYLYFLKIGFSFCLRLLLRDGSRVIGAFKIVNIGWDYIYYQDILDYWDGTRQA